MGDTGAMRVRSEQREGALVLWPEGDVDLSRSPSLRRSLRDASERKPKKLVVDLSEVPYMDSSGVATLVEAMQLARRYDFPLVLCSLQDKVRSIFEIARLDMVFRIEPNLDSALDA